MDFLLLKFILSPLLKGIQYKNAPQCGAPKSKILETLNKAILNGLFYFFKKVKLGARHGEISFKDEIFTADINHRNIVA